MTDAYATPWRNDLKLAWEHPSPKEEQVSIHLSFGSKSVCEMIKGVAFLQQTTQTTH